MALKETEAPEAPPSEPRFAFMMTSTPIQECMRVEGLIQSPRPVDHQDEPLTAQNDAYHLWVRILTVIGHRDMVSV